MDLKRSDFILTAAPPHHQTLQSRPDQSLPRPCQTLGSSDSGWGTGILFSGFLRLDKIMDLDTCL